MTISELIFTRRRELGLTLEEIGNAVGVSKSTVKKWESGHISNMRRDRIILLAEVLQVSPGTVLGCEESGDSADDAEMLSVFFDNIFPVKLKKFPLLGEIACGKPIFADEDKEAYIVANSDIKADFCLRCKGDSMTGARILDGDIVFIKEQPIVNNGEIAAVIIDGEATLKRWYFYPEKEKLVLSAENNRYEPLVFSGEELSNIRCLGKAIAFQSNVV